MGSTGRRSHRVIGSYRFDDPDGRVGMETHLVKAGDTVFQVPLTYHDEPLEGADGAFITEMQHSVLGTRWVYDGLRDPLFAVMLAAVTMTGQGEALGMAVYDGQQLVRSRRATSASRAADGRGTASYRRNGFAIERETTKRPSCSATTGSSSPRSVVPWRALARPSGSRRPGRGSRTPSWWRRWCRWCSNPGDAPFR